ncbi:EAL domain-containing protein [Alkalimarinus alittae]|uniref:EAL domain-containing protein n=1 Tax=Alkalimarinus alittae TaxID=2961619 RepID=A0ABY6N0Z5_9ALTE|nr:EAL domain-containing protein [Alkalimarinus alittae]UZE95674.1 EAL domain-containing protein [Alkalimarinus alittae]
MQLRLILLLATVLLSPQLFAAKNEVQPGVAQQLLNLSYVEDASNALNVDLILASEDSIAWTEVYGEIANFGYTDSPYWFKFTVSNPSNVDIDKLLEVSYLQLDYIDFYEIKNGEVVNTYQTGDRYPFSKRLIDHPYFLFPANLPAKSSTEYLLRVQTGGTVQLPAHLWDSQSFFVEIGKEDQIHAIFYGILAVLALFNFFIYLALREKTYLYYSMATFGYAFFFAAMRGKTFQVLFPSLPEIHNQSILIVIPFTMLFSALFARSFLSLKDYSKLLDQCTKVIAALAFACMVGSFFLSYADSVRISVLLSIPSYLILLAIGPIVWAKGAHLARYYTIAWGLLTAGTAMTSLNKAGVIPNSFISEYGMQIGSALEAILLTIALAERLYREREDKLTAQDSTIREHKERLQTEIKLVNQALHHPITQLPNRACFEMLISDSIRRRNEGRFAVCLINLTRFHEINKTLGHNNADLLIEEAASLINKTVQKLPGIQIAEIKDSDSFYAFSFEGATFGILIDIEHSEQVRESANEIIKNLYQPIEFKGMMLELDPAIGVSTFPENGREASTLIRHANVALETAEKSDRKLDYYQPEQDRYNARRLTLMSELKQAISNNQLSLYFQPKINLSTNTVTGLEALIRWHHQRFGFVRPDEFIPIAEQTGIIKPLTRWVVKEALRVQHELLSEGYDIDISINISAKNLREEDFVSFISEALTNNKKPKITIELTETSMMEDPLKALQVLEDLSQTGVRLSIDDFGTGYSSLAYIKKLPANEIKIDKSLIFDLTSNKGDQVIIKTTIEMCHQLGFTLVAEGVESQRVVDILKDLNCDIIQGYYISPPLPINKLKQWLADIDGYAALA